MKNLNYLLLTLYTLFANLAFGRDINSLCIDIIKRKCTICHNKNENVPFTILTNNDITKHKSTILYVINNQIMPPWHPDESYQSFENTLSLNNNDINLLNKWLSKNKIKPFEIAPPAITKNNKPKLTFHMNKSFLKEPNERDNFLWFQAPFIIKDSLYINSVRLNSTNKKSLHHCELFSTSQKNFIGDITKYEDKKDYIISTDTFWDDYQTSLFEEKKFIAGRFSSSMLQRYPKGVCNVVSPNNFFIYYTHYAPIPISDKDSSWFDIYLTESKDCRTMLELNINAFHNLINKPFFISADSINSFHCKKKVEDSISVFSIYPHAHHLCKKMLCFAVTPNNDTIPLYKTENWNFYWQWVYEYKKYAILPSGTIIHSIATFDNTSKNPDNPFSPPKDTNLSLKSTDEMMTIFLYYVKYKRGDENSVLEY